MRLSESSACSLLLAGLLGLPFGTALSACTTFEPAAPEPTVDFQNELVPMFENNCLCHQQGPDGTMEADTLTLTAALAYEQLVGTPSEQVPSLARVEPGSLEDSYLIHKLEGTHEDVGGMGDRMPPLADLDSDSKALIETWILEGAPEAL